jgi:hypothetical protein
MSLGDTQSRKEGRDEPSTRNLQRGTFQIRRRPPVTPEFPVKRVSKKFL